MIHLFRNVQKKFSNLRPTFRHRFIILMSKLFSKELESYVNKINHLRVSEFKYSMLFRRISIFLKSKVFCLQISIFYNPSESNFVSVQLTRVWSKYRINSHVKESSRSRMSTEHRIIRMKRIYLRQREETMPNLSWLDPFVSFMKDLIKRLDQQSLQKFALQLLKNCLTVNRKTGEKWRKFQKLLL